VLAVELQQGVAVCRHTLRGVNGDEATPTRLVGDRRGWFQSLDSFSDICRSTASGPLPAANAVTMLTGLLGNVLACCAKAGKANAATAVATHMARRVKGVFMVLSPL
jgi:hypothetical protein